MKVLLLQDHLRSGGTERQSILLTRSFRAAGVDAELITFRPGGKLWATAADVAPQALQTRDYGWDWYAPGLLHRVRQAKPDVVLAMGRMANCHLWRITRSFPTVRTVATFRTGKSIPLPYRKSLRETAAVVTNSAEAAAKLTSAYGITAAKITTIYNSLVFQAGAAPVPPLSISAGSVVAVPTSHPGAAALDAKAAPGAPGPVNGRRVVFLCVAMFRPEKNQQELIESFARLSDNSQWELWLAGDGPARQPCEARARALGLTGRIKFLGFQTDPSSLYAAADVAVHASYSEALSNFLIEAQAHGLPAIAYDAQGISECFIPGETGWMIPRGDRSAFCVAAADLMATLSDPGARQRIAVRAQAFARGRFDPARQVQAYLQLFSALLQR